MKPFIPEDMSTCHMPIPLAGNPVDWNLGDYVSPDSILSHTKGVFLPFFTTKDATVLRQICWEFKVAVTEHKWRDEVTKIKSHVGSWRVCFPVRPSICGSNATDEDFRHFAGLKSLNMSKCTQPTDAAFVHLKGIHSLDMSYCYQSNISDAAFVNLKGIHTLNMSECHQPTITDAAFVHLKGIHTLNMSRCSQRTITDAAFVNLKGIHTLYMNGCNQPTITQKSLDHFRT